MPMGLDLLLRSEPSSLHYGTQNQTSSFYRRFIANPQMLEFGFQNGVVPALLPKVDPMPWSVVAILFIHGFQPSIIHNEADLEGRFLILQIKHDKDILTLLNVYALTQNDPGNRCSS